MWSKCRQSTLHPPTRKLLAWVEHRFFRTWPVVAVARATTPVWWGGIPVGRGFVVDRLLKLVLVLRVLLAQGVVLGTQLILIGGSIGQCLLACLLVAVTEKRTRAEIDALQLHEGHVGIVPVDPNRSGSW